MAEFPKRKFLPYNETITQPLCVILRQQCVIKNLTQQIKIDRFVIMVRKKNSRLTLKERIQIETLLQQNKTKAYIAKIINRSRFRITREVNKWVQSDIDTYAAELANWNAKDDWL